MGVCVNKTFRAAVEVDKGNTIYYDAMTIKPKFYLPKGRPVIATKCNEDILPLTGLSCECSGSCTRSGWCYLEGVRDPADPTKDCFEDVKWSVKAQRFWSKQACGQDE